MKRHSLISNRITRLLLVMSICGMAQISSAQAISFNPDGGTVNPGQTVTVTATGNWPSPPTIFCTTDGSPANIAATLVGLVGSGGGNISVLEGPNQASETLNCVAALGAVTYQNVNASNSGWEACIGNLSYAANGTPTATCTGGVGSSYPSSWNFAWGSSMTEQMTGGDDVQILAAFLEPVCPLCNQPLGTQIMMAQSKTVTATVDSTILSNNEMDMESVDATNAIGGIPIEHNFGLQCEQSPPASNPGFWAIDGTGEWVPTTISDQCPWPINTPIEVIAQGWWELGDTGCGGNGCFNVLNITINGTVYDLSGTVWEAGFAPGTLAQPGQPGWSSFFGIQDQMDLTSAGGTAGRAVTGANVTEAYYNPNPVTASAAYSAPAPPAVSLSAASLNYNNVNVGGSSGSQSVILTNTGSAPLAITSITVTGAGASSFVFGNTCGSSIAAGAACTIHGHFSPSSIGTATAAVTVTDNANGSSQSIALSGTGIAPAVSLAATSLSFGSETVESSTASQSVTLTNSGTGVLTFSGIAVTGADATSFVFGTTCGSSLAVGASCTLHGHFTPATTGVLTAAVTIADNASGSPQSIALSGTGGAPAVSLSASNLVYGVQTVGTGSASQVVTLTNNGTGVLAFTSIAITGADASSFVFGTTCGSSLAIGASCTIHGHFAPTATGALAAAVTITDNANGSPQSIALSGTGQ